MRLTAATAHQNRLSHLGNLLSSRRSLLSLPTCFSLRLRRRRRPSSSCFGFKLSKSIWIRDGLPHRKFGVRAMDESFDDDWGSEGDESDGDFTLSPILDVDLPSAAKDKYVSANDPLTITVSRLAMLSRARRKKRIGYGIVNNMGLITFLITTLLFVDGCAWRIVKLPLPPLHLMQPFCISAILASFTGYVCVPLFRSLKIHRHSRNGSKKITATMGGLLFVPIGIVVAELLLGFSSIEVSASAIATLSLATVGLVDDVSGIVKNRNNGLSDWIRFTLVVAVGICFSLWLDSTKIRTPYNMKLLVPLPGPLGLVFVGKFYLFLTSTCFVCMVNGINMADKLDGLAGGTAAMAFLGMSIASLPICPDVSVFGASMAGACMGFLLHNRHKASILMGKTGSLALGGALASMAACTGMFLPLLISSAIFLLEPISVIIMQVFFVDRSSFLRQLALHGLKEPIIVAVAYVIAAFLSLLAGYVALVSV
ncbi:phospho-N-acetylmuramoyl-pentapeptide-transferase homolog [Impatiens glandulifera]|uniref:phospho-N-acetylmuramoyl-pentapeptide- transferase homolog n=1 Tax=Impatiens glandulifera TaxID=253017 RepID=UPI001FB0EA4C|nr:phospho-N-acetylmuramoyl-pentapeptide-transferase homolog [Impatiens glandulifera]